MPIRVHAGMIFGYRAFAAWPLSQSNGQIGIPCSLSILIDPSDAVLANDRVTLTYEGAGVPSHKAAAPNDFLQEVSRALDVFERSSRNRMRETQGGRN